MDQARTPQSPGPLACRLTEPEQRARRRTVIAELLEGAEERRSLDDGYALRFPPADRWISTLSDFVKTERECCPFLGFEVAVAPDGGPIWLRIRAPRGGKEVIGRLLEN